MRLFVQCPTPPNDWFIVELQGEVSAEAQNGELSFAGLTFADLSERDGQIYLTIGQHELKGSLIKLDKPLAVLKKATSLASESFQMDIDESSHANPSKTEYEVVGVVRQKYLFKDRPKVLLDLQSAL